MERPMVGGVAGGESPCDNGHVTRPDVDIGRLSPEDRLALLEEIWDSLTPDDVPLTEPQRRELDQRLNDLEQDGQSGIPWEEVLRRIRERAS